MALTAAEYEAKVDLVDDAIERVIKTGESVTFDGMTYNPGNLETLMKLRSFYEKKALRSSTGTRRVACFNA